VVDLNLAVVDLNLVVVDLNLAVVDLNLPQVKVSSASGILCFLISNRQDAPNYP